MHMRTSLNDPTAERGGGRAMESNLFDCEKSGGGGVTGVRERGRIFAEENWEIEKASAALEMGPAPS